MAQPTVTRTSSPGLFHWENNGGTKGLKTNFMEKRRRKGCQRCQCQNLVGTRKMIEALGVLFSFAIIILFFYAIFALYQEML